MTLSWGFVIGGHFRATTQWLAALRQTAEGGRLHMKV